MKVFLAASYSTKVDYSTGEVFPEYKMWLESILVQIEEAGHEVFNALRADGYTINDANPAEAFFLDKEKLEWCDVMIAYLEEKVSAGVQTEIGYAVAKGTRVIVIQQGELAWFNAAMTAAGVIETVSKFDPSLLE